MSAACIGEPVSWLRLEQLALAELDERGTSDVRTHLDACAACRDAFARITGDARPLPRLVVDLAEGRLPAAKVVADDGPPWWRRWVIAGGSLTVLAGAAAAVIMFWSVIPEPRPRPSVHVKGAGDVVPQLVRERDGAITFDARDVRDGDRWKVQLGCGRGGPAWVDVVVYQAREVGFPFAPQRIACGNEVVLPGAFRITGGGAKVCVALAADPPDRELLRARDHRQAICWTLAAAD